MLMDLFCAEDITFLLAAVRSIFSLLGLAQSARAAEYTNCFEVSLL